MSLSPLRLLGSLSKSGLLSQSDSFLSQGASALVKGTSAAGVISDIALSLGRQHRFNQVDMENGILPDSSTPVGEILRSLSRTLSSGVISQGSGKTSSTSYEQENNSFLERIVNLGSILVSPITGLAQMLSGAGGQTLIQTITNPQFQIGLGIIGIAAILYPHSDKRLRNVNILIKADEESKTYEIGIGTEDFEQKITLQVKSGEPIIYPRLQGIDSNKIKEINFDESRDKSSISFLSLFGFLNVFKYYSKEKMSVYNIVINDPEGASKPKVTKAWLSNDMVVQIIHANTSNVERIFDILAGPPKRSKSSSKPEDIDHVQLVTIDLDTLDENDSLVLDKCIKLPPFDGKTTEFVHITQTNDQSV